MKTIELNDTDKAILDRFSADAADILASLGALRETFRSQEDELLSQLRKAREQKQTFLKAICDNYLKDQDGKWLFESSTRTFVQTQGVKDNGTSHDHEQPVQQ